MSKQITIDLPEEFIELCNEDGIEPETVLRGFIADLCGLMNWANNPVGTCRVKIFPRRGFSLDPEGLLLTGLHAFSRGKLPVKPRKLVGWELRLQLLVVQQLSLVPQASVEALT